MTLGGKKNEYLGIKIGNIVCTSKEWRMVEGYTQKIANSQLPL